MKNLALKDNYPPALAERVASLQLSPIKRMELEARSQPNVISLCLGMTSHPTPQFIVSAACKGLTSDPVTHHYTVAPGLRELREEISRYICSQAVGGAAPDPSTEVIVTAGCMEATAVALTTLLNPGDEVILPCPSYVSHISQVRLAGGRPVFVPLISSDRWELDLDALRNAVSARTKAIIVTSPSNPTGHIFTDRELTALAELALRHKLYLILDTAYDQLAFVEMTSSLTLLSNRELAPQLIIAGTFSKLFCMSGWRVGYTVAPASLSEKMLVVHDLFQHCASTISQLAALEALRLYNNGNPACHEWLLSLRQSLLARRDYVVSRLGALTELFTLNHPEGAIFVFPRIVGHELDDVKLASRLLHEAGVAVTPGSAFGPFGANHLRLVYGASEADLVRACDRLETWSTGQLQVVKRTTFRS